MKSNERIAIVLGVAGIGAAWYWSRQQNAALAGLAQRLRGIVPVPSPLDPTTIGGLVTSIPPLGTPVTATGPNPSAIDPSTLPGEVWNVPPIQIDPQNRPGVIVDPTTGLVTYDPALDPTQIGGLVYTLPDLTGA
jgi:hypothetical protein